MRVNLIRLVLPAAALAAFFGATACGSIATPEWAVDAQETQAAQAATSDHLTAIAPTSTPTITPLPPTATRTSLPTATLAPTNTAPAAEMPTAAATIAPPTEAATAEVASGDPARGETVFNTPHQMPDGVTWACSTCHVVAAGAIMTIGPNLWNVSIHGVEHQHMPGMTPDEYIRNSIINPQAVIAPHPLGVQWPLEMPPTWAEVLSEQDINVLVAYVMTLHD
jgi:mono/diheme cytochrome c family protein